MKTIVIFQSPLFEEAWPEDGNFRVPWGKDCAYYLMEKLSSKGVVISNDEPIASVEGWEVDLKVDGNPITLFVHWLPIGEPPENYWGIQPMIRRGLGALFRKATVSTDVLQVVCKLLDEVLREEKQIANVKWLTPEEFDLLY